MSLKSSGQAVRFCAPVFRKTPPHVHPVINMAAEACPVLPKVHPSRNLQTMGSSMWAKFEKECPFAKIVQKNYGNSDQATRPNQASSVSPMRMYGRRAEDEIASEQSVKESEEQVVAKPAKKGSNVGTINFPFLVPLGD